MLRIKELCKEKGITMAEVAKRLHITAGALSQNVSGRASIDRLQEIADILNVSIVDLFDKKDGDINGYIKVKGTIYEITSFEDLEKVLKLKE